MRKLVVYQRKGGVWLCDITVWNQYQYDNEIKPIRMSIMEMSEQYVEMLMELFRIDKETFIEMLKDELNNTFSLYMN